MQEPPMTRGRKPKSPEDRQRDGDTTHRPERDASGDGVRPDRPGGLPRDSRLAWEQIVDEMEAVGILDSRDWPIIEAMAVAVGKARIARRAWQKFERKTGDLYYVSPNGAIARHPALTDEKDAWADVSRLSDKLGIGPEGRARVGLKRNAADNQPKDPMGGITDDLPGLTAIDGGKV